MEDLRLRDAIASRRLSRTLRCDFGTDKGTQRLCLNPLILPDSGSNDLTVSEGFALRSAAETPEK
jgi:hypothetical protein